MAQAPSYFAGFETGDASEVFVLGAGASVQGTTVRTGSYALKQAATTSALVTLLATTLLSARFYLRMPALPGATQVIATVERPDAVPPGTTTSYTIQFNASNKLQVVEGGDGIGLTTTTGTATFLANVWYRIETAYDRAAGGIVRVWVDGVLDIDTTHTSAGAALIDGITVKGAANPNEYFFDDVRTDSGGVAPIGAGQIIARQGVAGTPTYNAWTKNGLGTAALCWSETPFSATNNCSDNVLNDAQTMLVSPFSSTQGGHGTQVISTIDAINACKVAMIAKTASAGNTGLRRRVATVDTDVTIALTTSDAYYDSGIFTDTPGHLDAYEIGAKNLQTATLQTVEDMWLMVDYTPGVPVTPPLLLPQCAM